MYKNMIRVRLVRLLFLLMTTFVYSQQKIEYYNYGYDGMEKIGRVSDSMVVYSNYKSRPLIREEVCDSILDNYRKLKNGSLVIKIKSATVFGRLEIIRKHKLIAVNYYYERIEYVNGLVEIYKKPIINEKKRVVKK